MRGMIEGKMPVILRVRTSGSILNAIAFAKKHKLKGILSGAAEAWKVADKIKESGYPVIITASGESTLSANQPLNDFDPYDSPYINPWALNRAGVLWCFQSDDNAMSFNLPMRAGFHTAYGVSQDDAIDALTRDAAKILGLHGEVGTLKIGAKADLIVTNGHPVESTTTVVGAFLGGTPVPMVSKHTMLRDRYMARIGK
jgi:imidazolonepropionase-like amidohydrolase